MIRKSITALLFAAIGLSSQAQNPLIRQHYSADPAPVVFNDRMYIYYDRDEGPDWYVMNEWRVISSSDLVNWTDHGIVLPITAFKWADAASHSAWASQCIERNGKYYWYVCMQYKGDWRHTIGVAVSDRPEGPFKDALGKPLVPVIEGGQIDPTVFIDDDGQAYLYYGNNLLRYVKLNEDMISYDKKIGNNGIVTVELTKEAFGGVKKERTKADGSKETYVDGVDAYEEGPWLHKYNGKYYLSYAAGGVPEHMAYSMSDSPVGPWKYKGQVMPLQNTSSFTQHGGIVEFRGKHYVAYHTGWLPGGGGFTRSLCLDEMFYNADGTIKSVNATKNGVKAAGTLNPYEEQQAETMNTGTGLWVYTKESPRTIYVGDIDQKDTLRVRAVDFKDGAAAVTAYVSSPYTSGYIEVYADKYVATKMLAKIPVAYTENEENWQPVTVPVTGNLSGVHDILFRFNCSNAKEKTHTFTFDRWQFAPKTDGKTLVGLNAQLDKTIIDTDATYDNTVGLTVMAVYSDGTTEDVTVQAAVEVDGEAKLSREGATLTATAYGRAELTISYGGFSTKRYLNVRSYFNENAVGSLTVGGDYLKEGLCVLLNGSVQNLTATAHYLDGHQTDVTSTATFQCEDATIVSNVRGKLTAKQDGQTRLTVSYQGKLGEEQTSTVDLQVSTFPLVSGLLNPNLIGTGSFTEKTRTLKTAKNGLAGWKYDKNINLSGYAYLVIRLTRASLYKPTFRLYDSTDANGSYYAYEMNKDTEAVIPLKDLVKSDGSALNLSRIRIAGFSTTGGSVAIDSIYLTNEDPTGINRLQGGTASSAQLYDLNGRRVSSQSSAHHGLYVKQGRKVVK